jgi:LuxR family maltose regulon positive regulatory protein
MAVLGTKIHRPAPRRDLVHRSRLTDRLATGEQPRLVLVSAPAGFGKTTLLSQWLADRPSAERSVAWLSLDPDDNDPRRFLEHLVASLAVSGRFAEAAALVPTSGPAPTEAVLTSIVNELDLLPHGTVLALDDYHVIEGADVHAAVTFLLDHLPPRTTLAVATRSDPPLPLPRLRARGELVELRAADLRFTPDEAAAFLADVMGLDLSTTLVSALESRTEGWAAGLQLAGLSLRGVDDPAPFVAAFTGSHRFVLDYLVEEVLRHQPEHVRRFLLDTAVLHQLSGPLCDALTQGHDGTTMLEALDRANLFVVPLDDERRWYRYHHLFADALRARLGAEDPGRVAALHRSASNWYAAHRLLEDAVRHALAGDDPEHAADLVERALPDLRRARRDRVVRDWLTALPDDTVRRRALLATYRGWTRLVEGDLEGVASWLTDAERALEADPPAPPRDASVATLEELRTLPATIEIFRAAAAQATGDTAATTAHARRALERTGPGDHMARGGALGFLGLAAWGRGDLGEAVETFSRAVEGMAAAGDVSDEVGSTVVLASMWLDRGRPAQARRLLERALGKAGQHPGAALATHGDLHATLAGVLVEQGQLGAADEHLHAAQRLGESASLLENRHRWFLASARLREACGDLEGALAMLDRAEQTYVPGFFPDVRPIPAQRARVWTAAGRHGDAWGWVRDHGVRETQGPGFLDEYDQLTLVRLLLAQHRTDPDQDLLDESTTRLDQLVPGAANGGRDGSLVEIGLLRALVHDAAGNRVAATAELSAALEQGVPAGYARLFLDEGEPVERLLAQAERRPAAARHVQALRHAAYRKPLGDNAPAGAEGLSEREVEVLRLLASTLSGPEIARALYVSVNTLRTHTKHIFTKLEVNTRRAAVARAQELGLL